MRSPFTTRTAMPAFAACPAVVRPAVATLADGPGDRIGSQLRKRAP